MDDDDRGPWAQEVVDLVRAAAAGMLFGIPLLFTMEVWWTGTHTAPAQMLGVLLATALPVFILNRTQGFRSKPETTLGDSIVDTVETIAVALLCVTAVLFLLHEIDTTTPMRTALGKIVYEAVPFCIGIGIAQHFLREARSGGDSGDGTPNGRRADRTSANATLADLGATLIGATFVALNIAPTDEIPMLAAAIGSTGLFAVIGVSLLISYAIVFEGGFANEEQRRTQPGIFQHPVTETVVGYIVALLGALIMLWLFQRLGGPWTLTLSHVVVLGLPAAVGGAAGRLAV